MLDVLVIGAGPCGLAAAIESARAGFSVAVIESSLGTIDKACGEGLMPSAVTALGRLGATVERSFPFVGIRYVGFGASAEARFRDGPGLGVRRTILHAALERRALALGVERIVGRVAELRQSSDHVVVAGHRARWVIAADGLRSGARRQLGLELPPRGPARLGIRRHFRAAPWSEFVEVHWSADAEAYVTPVAPDEIGIALLFFADSDSTSDEGSRFDRLLAGFPHLRERLGAPTSAVRGAGPFEQRLRARMEGRVLLVGDAAGYLDPLTGEGLRLGFSAAAAAVRCIRDGEPQRYNREWWSMARRYWWMTSGLLSLARSPRTRSRLIPVLARAPWLMRAAVNALSR